MTKFMCVAGPFMLYWPFETAAPLCVVRVRTTSPFLFSVACAHSETSENLAQCYCPGLLASWAHDHTALPPFPHMPNRQAHYSLAQSSTPHPSLSLVPQTVCQTNTKGQSTGVMLLDRLSVHVGETQGA